VIRVCWHCSKKLYGNKFAVISVFGFDRTVHIQCAEDIKKHGPESTTYDNKNLSDIIELEQVMAGEKAVIDRLHRMGF